MWVEANLQRKAGMPDPKNDAHSLPKNKKTSKILKTFGVSSLKTAIQLNRLIPHPTDLVEFVFTTVPFATASIASFK